MKKPAVQSPRQMYKTTGSTKMMKVDSPKRVVPQVEMGTALASGGMVAKGTGAAIRGRQFKTGSGTC